MRSAIRNAIKEYIPEFVDVFEPSVPNRNTEKPYAVIQQVNDSESVQGAIGSERKINIWIYNDRTSFKELDSMQKKIIEAINFKPLFDDETKKHFTCIYKGVTSSDVNDPDWDIIARPLSFSVIALDKADNVTADNEVSLVCMYLEEILKNNSGINISVYKNGWNQDLTIPAILVRTNKVERKTIVNNLNQVDKTMKIHVVDTNVDRMINIIERIEDKLILDKLIVFNKTLKDGTTNRWKLELARLSEDRESDMFTLGQITATFRYYIKSNTKPIVIDKIYDDKGLKIEKR
jgi:hypothetical protein|nr:MAG TPA: hypothetical protein [Caudoviricetes sp.]